MERKRFFWDSSLAIWIENRVECLAEWINFKRYPITQYGEGWVTVTTESKKPLSNTVVVYEDPYQYTNDVDYIDLNSMPKPLAKPTNQMTSTVEVVKKPRKKKAEKKSAGIKKI